MVHLTQTIVISMRADVVLGLMWNWSVNASQILHTLSMRVKILSINISILRILLGNLLELLGKHTWLHILLLTVRHELLLAWLHGNRNHEDHKLLLRHHVLL